VSAFVCAVTAGLLADGGANHQRRNSHYGVSGGNVNFRSRAFCCSGTLGALVRDGGGALYILSNNHVLARTGQAAAGEDVSQPGLIDNGCRIATVVADFTIAPALGSNVDAAIAGLRSGQMDANGVIEDIGQPSQFTSAPAVGCAVAKSGRTTGFTTASIGSIDTDVNVQYQKGCGSGKKFIVSYTNQVVINSNSFSAGGDSGSLIVTDDSAHRPVGLLYAGSSTTTIGNPIDEVLTKVGSSLGSNMTFVGSADNTGGCAGAAAGGVASLSLAELDRARGAKNAHARRLMADPAVMAVGLGAHPENPSEAVLMIYVEQGKPHLQIASQLNGVRTQVIRTDRIRAFGWNESEKKSCSRQ
jgi:hypothetical protein